MKTGTPALYRVFRGVWSLLHIALLVLVALVLASWWFHDRNGAHLLSAWWSRASHVQKSISNAIPFPWH
jgi:hypothetical protein